MAVGRERSQYEVVSSRSTGTETHTWLGHDWGELLEAKPLLSLLPANGKKVGRGERTKKYKTISQRVLIITKKYK